MSDLFGWMKVSRASSCKGSPCEGAEKRVYTRVRRSWQDDSDFRSRGTNHREENGAWFRDEVAIAWMVFIEDGEAMIDFIRKNGRIIIDVNTYASPECLEITIYDDYLE